MQDVTGDNTLLHISKRRRTAAWLVHLFTASGAAWGLLALWSIHNQRFTVAFWFMAAAILVDAVDGTLARQARTKEATPMVDAELLDNIIDYFNYTMVPAFFLLVSGLLPFGWALLGGSLIGLASAYQFTQPDAKTDDHFFKGFPSYWNIVVFYLFFWQMPPFVNLAIILFLVLMVFVPIKYIYPSRLEYVSSRVWVRWAVLGASVVWGVATIGMLVVYPGINPLFVFVSMGYGVFYFLMSLYRTFFPVKLVKKRR
ncbi:MAG: Phosphatidylcholine synthase [Anaerolineae bacterium]|nr:Phosphatidylcholine synthase [Anaerolineae bacterium]